MYEQNPATTSNNHISDHLQNLAFKKKRAQKQNKLGGSYKKTLTKTKKFAHKNLGTKKTYDAKKKITTKSSD